VILDTCAVSAFLAKEPAVGRIAARAALLCIPVIVLGEYRYGLRASKARQALEQKLDDLVADATVLVVDDTTATHYASVRDELRKAGRPIPENDVWIAALARQHGLPIVTQDAHFDSVSGARRIGW
jgi:tRNA(fMet)-specific endonuclease VapC